VLPGEGRRFEWNLVDEPTTTYVSLVPVAGKHRLITACYSAFADGAFLETVLPERSDSPPARSGRPRRRSNTEESIRPPTHQRLAGFAVDHGRR
jgi:hypothetical protein